MLFQGASIQSAGKNIKGKGSKGRVSGVTKICILRETKNKIRVEGKLMTFSGQIRVRQGYPLSPELFNLLMADLERYVRKGVGKGKINGGKSLYTSMCR